MTDSKKKHGESLLKVYHTGDVTVVGFGGHSVNNRVDFGPYRGVLTDLVRRHQCRILAVDLAGVKHAPAGMLGVLLPLRKLVERIEIHNPTETARPTLETMQVGSLFDICDSVA